MFDRLFVICMAISLLSACCSKPKDKEYPQKPSFDNLVSNSDRDELFGEMEYEPWFGKGKIKITNGWDANYLVKAYIPQLKGILDYNNNEHSGFTRLNKKVERQYKMLWHAWEKQGLLDQIHSWGGGYAARKVTGSYIFLSNHAYGTAFDINTRENSFNREPAKRGEEGSVYDLVSIAHEHGFYWGGHFCTLDGMHFEASLILSDDEISKLNTKYGYNKNI